MHEDSALAALLTPEGRALVDSLTPYEPDEALHQLTRARRDPRWAERPDVIAAAATQARLRTRAAARFPGPPRWWTPDGLEQATRAEVAALHATRYVAAGIRAVADLGSGAGSDALTLAEQGIDVHAVDLDPDALWALSATAADRSVTVRTERGDVTSAHWWWNEARGLESRGCFVDPARRRAGQRLRDPEHWSPPWSWVRGLATRVPATGAKVAPGIDHGALPTDAQAEWVSVAGELVECGVWWGPLRQGAARRTATVAAAGGSPTRTTARAAALTVRSARAPEPSGNASSGQGETPRTWVRMDDAAGVPEPAIGPVGGWLVEPDPAVIRAGLVSVLACDLGGRLLDPRIAYVTADAAPASTPFGVVYEVVEEVPFARKRLRAHLRAAGYGDVVVKKRGVAVVPEQVRGDLRLSGDGPTAILVLTRTDAGPLALLVRRVTPSATSG